MKRVDHAEGLNPSVWSSPSDLDKRESGGRDSPQGVAPHSQRGVVGAQDGEYTHREYDAHVLKSVFSSEHSTC